MNAGNSVQWSVENGAWMATGATQPTLPPGKYLITIIPFTGWGLKPITIASDEPIIATDSHADQIFKGILKFVAAKPRYDKWKRLHKRGILMNSLPGAGKTMTCMAVAEKVASSNGIALFSDSNTDPRGISNVLQQVRAVHPNMLIFNVMEDLDRHDADDFEDLLDILDGKQQVNNIVHMATTNYIGELDERLTKRPGRFDDVITVAPPSAEVRKSFFAQLIPTDEQTPGLIDKLVKVSDGFLYSHMKGLAVDHMVLGKPIDALAKELRTQIPTQITPKKRRGLTTAPVLAEDNESCDK